MSEVENDRKPIITEMRASKLFWIKFRLSLFILLAIALIDAGLLAYDLMWALRRHSVMAVFFPLIHGVVFLFCAHFIVIYCKLIFGKAKRKSTVKTVVYFNRMIMVTNNSAVHGEEMYRTVDFTKNRETKKYFFVTAPGTAGNVIDKRRLDPEQLNAIRRVFALPVKDGGEIALPVYDEEVGAEREISRICDRTAQRFIKTSFSNYYSRDKKMMRAQVATSIVATVLSFAALIFTSACYAASDAIWAATLTYLSDVALVAFAVWLDNIVYDLKQSKNVSLGGTVSENMFFADRLIVYSHGNNSFSVRVVPYDEIVRVRETKEDIWIDYPKGLTHVTVKSDLTRDEYHTEAVVEKSPAGRLRTRARRRARAEL